MSAAKRVAHAAETVRARWERDIMTDPQTDAAQALEDSCQLLDPEVAEELRRLRAEAPALRARVAELEAERAKYVGVEPTIAEEMAYLSRCVNAVDALKLPESLKADSIDPQYRNGYVHALADMRTALESPVRESYPPALPWAALMDDEDLSDFLDELADAAGKPDTYQGALAEVEATCGRWRLTAEAQHGHNTAPGPDAIGERCEPALTIYRASHESIVMGLYTTAAAAREHCETEERRSWAKFEHPTFDWIEDDEDGVAEMTAFVGGEECETGYEVTALEIASKYDPEVDE